MCIYICMRVYVYVYVCISKPGSKWFVYAL